MRAIIALRSKLSQDVIDSGRFVGKPSLTGLWKGYPSLVSNQPKVSRELAIR